MLGGRARLRARWRLAAGMGDVEGEGGDLGEGVDAGVGAAGALREDGLAGDVVDGLGESALDGGKAGLDLPAVEGRAVVGEDESSSAACVTLLDGNTVGSVNECRAMVQRGWYTWLGSATTVERCPTRNVISERRAEI